MEKNTWEDEDKDEDEDVEEDGDEDEDEDEDAGRSWETHLAITRPQRCTWRKSAASVKQQLLHQKRSFHLIQRKLAKTNKTEKNMDIEQNRRKSRKVETKTKATASPDLPGPHGVFGGVKSELPGTPRNSPEEIGASPELPGTPRNSPEEIGAPPELPGTPRNFPELP